MGTDVSHRTDLDDLIAQKLTYARLSRNVSATDVAKAIGINQHVYLSYEDGKRRIFASRLYRAARVLGVPISSFFPEPIGIARRIAPELYEQMYDLIEAFGRLPARQRAAVHLLINSMLAPKDE